MSRLACVNLPHFRLQLLLRSQPMWRDYPVAVLSGVGAVGVLLSVNRHARRYGLQPGENYLTALSRCPALRGATVGDAQVRNAGEKLIEQLGQFSPEVEMGHDREGVFWFGCSGLEPVFGDSWQLARRVADYLGQDGFFAGVCVGFTRFGTYALAAQGGVCVPQSPNEEARRLLAVPLRVLGAPTGDLNFLNTLGVTTVGGLGRLSEAGVAGRFSPEVVQLWRSARRGAPLERVVPVPAPVKYETCLELDEPDGDAVRFLFAVKQLLSPLLERLAQRGLAVTRIHLRLDLDRQPAEKICLGLARPSLDLMKIIDLVRLRFEALHLLAGVVRVKLAIEPVEAPQDQLMLFESARRSLDKARDAIARLRARFGVESVQVTALKPGHLPEGQWRFLSDFKVAYPKVSSDKSEQSPPFQIQRRVYQRPLPLNTRPVRGPGGIHLGGMDNEPVKEMVGPYRICGGWWVRAVDREYYFAMTGSKKWQWVYYDRLRRRWFCQGGLD